MIKHLVDALGVDADKLIFDKNKRIPGEEFQLQFEALLQFDEEERKIAKTLL